MKDHRMKRASARASGLTGKLDELASKEVVGRFDDSDINRLAFGIEVQDLKKFDEGVSKGL
jgi:hypothetical protein